MHPNPGSPKYESLFRLCRDRIGGKQHQGQTNNSEISDRPTHPLLTSSTNTSSRASSILGKEAPLLMTRSPGFLGSSWRWGCPKWTNCRFKVSRPDSSPKTCPSHGFTSLCSEQLSLGLVSLLPCECDCNHLCPLAPTSAWHTGGAPRMCMKLTELKVVNKELK